MLKNGHHKNATNPPDIFIALSNSGVLLMARTHSAWSISPGSIRSAMSHTPFPKTYWHALYGNTIKKCNQSFRLYR